MFNRLILSAEQADTVARLFWRLGFNGAPLDQIAIAAGLTLEQLTAQFGGRNGLFLVLLRHYRSRLMPGKSNFVAGGPGLQALQRLFAGLIQSHADADLPPAYLMIGTASEIGSRDLMLSAAVQSYFDEIRAMLTRIVRDAVHSGDLIPGVDCEAAGDFLLGALLALRMMHRINAAPMMQRNFVSGVMHYLERLRYCAPKAELEKNTSQT